jgi:HK97 gp10 family phage protein
MAKGGRGGSSIQTRMVSNRFHQLTAVVNAESAKVKAKVEMKILQSAQKTVAVDTGATRDSGEITEDGVEFGEAALFLEFGTVKMAAQPFLGPASTEGRDGFNKYFAEMFVGLQAAFPPTPPY